MFKTEKQLVNELKKSFHSMCSWNTLRFPTHFIQEVNLGFGIADLVIYKLKDHQIRSDQNLELNHFDISIYKIIEKNRITSVDLLHEVTGATKKTINTAIQKLIENSYIQKHDSIIKFCRSYQKATNEVIAIEAKLKNWKRALDQAYRYKWFASQSFVVLDTKNIMPAKKNIQAFQKLNVGLAEINNFGVVKIIYKPLKNVPIDEVMPLVLNEFIIKLLRTEKKRSPSL
ncbi:MAG: hypothetical protein ABJA78_03470 [Ferruginibacter sp.]